MERDDPPHLTACRDFYAKLVAVAGGPLRDRLEHAFAAVGRERFLGPGPWRARSIYVADYVQTPTDDPIHLYQNLLFALREEEGINNGEPCLHGQLLGTLNPQEGETVLHIGCGTGYYTAILAQLIGPKGKVIGYEINSDLAARKQGSPPPSSASPSNGFKVSDRVRHPTFGEGQILAAKPTGNDQELTVMFRSHGTKRLLASAARLENHVGAQTTG